MSNINHNAAMPEPGNMIHLLNHIGPARHNMAVVEPVAIPVLPAPQDMVFQFNLKKKIFRYLFLYRI
jgi:hypothetical protein